MNNNNQKWIKTLLNRRRYTTLKDVTAGLKLQGVYWSVEE
jgi:hypothetical protein